MKQKSIQIFFIFLVISVCSSEKKLTKIIALVAHGPTYPKVYDITENPNTKDTSNDSNNGTPGNLTNNGYRMMYSLGQSINEQIKSTTGEDVKLIENLDQISIISGKDHKYNASAQAFVLGLLSPNFDVQETNFDVDYSVPDFDQPAPNNSALKSSLPNQYYPFAFEIPFHLRRTKSEKIFEPYTSESDCSRYHRFINLQDDKSEDTFDKVLSPLIKKNPDLKRIYDNLEASDTPYPSIVLEIMDFVNSSKYNNPNYFMSEKEYHSFKLYSDSILWNVLLADDALKIQVSEILRVIKGNFEKESGKKVVVMQGSPTNIWALLSLFQLSNSECILRLANGYIAESCYPSPPFGSSLLFLFYENGSESTFGRKSSHNYFVY